MKTLTVNPAAREKPCALTLRCWVEYEPSPYRGIEHLILAVRIGEVDVTDQLTDDELAAVQKYLQDTVPFWEAA